jgi:methanogenic corrinoid protein MtbC1
MTSTNGGQPNQSFRDRTKVVVGGQPIDEKVSEYMGADYYGADAPAGVRICREIYAME